MILVFIAVESFVVTLASALAVETLVTAAVLALSGRAGKTWLPGLS